MRHGAALLVLSLSLLVAACRTLAPVVPLQADAPDTQALVDSLDAERAARRSLRGTLRLGLDGPQGSFRATQLLIAERPSQLRVEVQGLLAQTVAVLVTDGEQFELFRTRERTIDYGPVYPGLLRDVARIDLEPAEVVEMTLGAPAIPPDLHVAAALRQGDEIRLELADAAGRPRARLAFGPARELRRAERLDDVGAPLWRAAYEDFREVGGVSFAHSLRLEFPPSHTEALLQFQRVELNPRLPENIFVFRVPHDVGAPPLGSGG